MPKKKPKVIVAISGGIDSAVAAALLKRAGFLNSKGITANKVSGLNVEGVFLKLCDSRRFEEAARRARKVAQTLKIPFRVLNLQKQFKKKVIDYFLREWRAGRTPNPCVVCNKEIKFGFLLGLSADFAATGHYAKLQKGRLFRGRDKEKDQSYFLWRLTLKELKRILLPLGKYTKKEVRVMARKLGLPVFEASESEDICFTPPAIKQKPGQIVDTQNRPVGRHHGLVFYTVGQRKGIGLSGGPYWVMGKDLKRNILLVTKNEKDLYKKELTFKNANWLSPKGNPRFPTGQAGKIKAKIRYRAKLASGKFVKPNKFIFDKPQRAVTPGQSVVFYKGEELLGGGIICG